MDCARTSADEIIALVRRRDALIRELAEIDQVLVLASGHVEASREGRNIERVGVKWRFAIMVDGARQRGPARLTEDAARADLESFRSCGTVAPRGARSCGRCGLAGHYAKTCRHPDPVATPDAAVISILDPIARAPRRGPHEADRIGPKRSPTKEALVIRTIPMLKRIAARMWQKHQCRFELGDLESFGALGLLSAAENFDPDRGVKFGTFAWYRIEGAILDGVREMGPWSRADSKRYKADPESGIKFAPLDEARDVAAGRASDEIVDEAREHHRLRRAIAELPDRQRSIIEASYFAESTLEDAGAAMGITKSWASRQRARALDMLRLSLAPSPEGHRP